MSQSDTDSRVVVKTYVPHGQKRIWEDHADELEMTMSEFVRTMVQSGRAPFTVDDSRSSDGNPRSDDLQTAILDVLENGPATFDELSADIIGNREEELDRTLQAMDQVTISGRTGQYSLTES